MTNISKLTMDNISNSEGKVTYKCQLCGRVMDGPVAHKCSVGFRKRGLVWQKLFNDSMSHTTMITELERHKAEIHRLNKEIERLNHIVRKFRNVATILKGIDFNF